MITTAVPQMLQYKTPNTFTYQQGRRKT